LIKSSTEKIDSLHEEFETLLQPRWDKEVDDVILKYGEGRKWTPMSALIKKHFGKQIDPSTLLKRYNTLKRRHNEK
jgi:hypothetical protein